MNPRSSTVAHLRERIALVGSSGLNKRQRDRWREIGEAPLIRTWRPREWLMELTVNSSLPSVGFDRRHYAPITHSEAVEQSAKAMALWADCMQPLRRAA